MAKTPAIHKLLQNEAAELDDLEVGFAVVDELEECVPDVGFVVCETDCELVVEPPAAPVFTPLTVPPDRLVDGIWAISLMTDALNVPVMLVREKKPEKAMMGIAGVAGSGAVQVARMKYTFADEPMPGLTVNWRALVCATSTAAEISCSWVWTVGFPV